MAVRRTHIARLRYLWTVTVIVMGGCWLRGEASTPAPKARPAAQEPVETPPASTTDVSCEVLDHDARCRLESVVALDTPSTTRREVVAIYRVMDPSIVLRIERRYGVSYLGSLEADVIDHVRAHAVVDCHWQTVVRGVCNAAAPSLSLPEPPQRALVEASR